jgi:hypothetical protein
MPIFLDRLEAPSQDVTDDLQDRFIGLGRRQLGGVFNLGGGDGQ